MLVVDEIPHPAVTAGIKHRVEVVLPDGVETDGLIKLRLRVE
jgi:hypothetical protein